MIFISLITLKQINIPTCKYLCSNKALIRFHRDKVETFIAPCKD